MSGNIDRIQTGAITSNVASATSDLLSGVLEYIKIEVRTSAGAASASTCTVTITDNIMGRTLLTATGITGIANEYPLQVQAKGVTGSAITGVYQKYYLVSQRLSIAVTAGTDTNYVVVFAQVGQR